MGTATELLELKLAAASVPQAKRDEFAKKGVALPDGSYPIPDESHLRSAVKLAPKHKSYPPGKVLAHVAKRARALGKADMIKDNPKFKGH